MRNKRRLKGFTRAFFCWASCLGKRVSRRRSSSVKWRTSKVIQNQKFRRCYWVVFSGAVFVVTFPFFLFVCFSVLMLVVSFSFFFFWNWIHDLRFYDTVILPIFLALKIFLPFLPFTQLRNIPWLKEFFEVTHFVKSLLWLIKSQLHKHEKYGFLSLFFILYERLFLLLFRRVLQGRLLNLPRRFSLKAHYEFHILVIIWFRVDYSVIILSLKFYFTIHAFINAFFFFSQTKMHPKQKSCVQSPSLQSMDKN